jgi:hypothetical protein
MPVPGNAFNLQFGKGTLSYQDVILLFQIIPNNRGSHSDISGM